MAQIIKHNLYGFLFRFFSFLADKTGGNSLFVKPKVLLGSLVLGLCSESCSTVPTTANNVQPQSEKKDVIKSIANTNREEIFCYHIEQMPQFPGGEKAMMEFLSKNSNYANVISSDGRKPAGRVVLKFAINEDGSISDITVVRSLDSLCDKEAIRVVSLMPKFIPGKQNGEVCKVWYNLPIDFRGQ